MKQHLVLIAILVIASFSRLYQLDKYPAGLNADEASIGYNAYSLLQTGKDEYGKPWPLVFRSFDDYKPPIYFYLTLPFIKVLGPTVLAVRLPSAILSILAVYLIYLFCLQLFKSQKIALLSALMLTVSPWHLQFSRGAWEVNASTSFLLLSLVLFLKGRENIKYWYLSALLMVISLYTYHSLRLIIPLLLIGLWYIYQDQITPRIKQISPIIAIASLLLTPLFFQMSTPEGVNRFNGVSIFADQGPLWEALELRADHQNSYIGKILHNKYLSYSLRFGKNYLSHFSNRFLFINGDEIARSKTPENGQVLIYLFPFWFLGLFRLFKKFDKPEKTILLWLFVAPIAAALTFQSPHALRSENMVIPLSIVIALGISSLFSHKLPLVVLTGALVTFSFVKYLHMYYVHYPQELAYAWQYGFDQVADYVKENGQKYDHIIITDRYDQPYILMAFFLKYPPQLLQKEIILTPRDQFGFGTVRSFGNFQFHQIDHGKDLAQPKTLVISADEYVPEKFNKHQFLDPGGKIIFTASDNL